MSSIGAPYFAGKTKAQLERDVRGIVGGYGLDEEFESNLISDLIAAKHYYCSQHGLRPTRFRKRRNGTRNGYDFEGYFPGHGWHLVSWRQSIYPCRDEDWIVRALRDAVQPEMTRRREQFPVCERCNRAASEETDHVDPEFAAIAREALAALSDADWQAIVAGFDWWSEEPFTLPPDSPALRVLRKLHETAQLQAVCRKCHLLNAAER